MKPVLELVGDTFKIYKENLGLVLGYSAWMLLPIIARTIITLAFGSPTSMLSELMLFLLDGVIISWVILCIIQITDNIISKTKIDTKKISSKSWANIIPMILIGIINSVITILGFVLFIIPGFIAMAMLVFSTAILVLENKGVIESIKASYSLSKERLGAVLGRVLGGEFVLMIPYFLIYVLITILLIAMNNWDVDAFVNSPTTLMEQIITRVADTVFLPLIAIFSVILYKTAKETR